MRQTLLSASYELNVNTVMSFVLNFLTSDIYFNVQKHNNTWFIYSTYFSLSMSKRAMLNAEGKHLSLEHHANNTKVKLSHRSAQGAPPTRGWHSLSSSCPFWPTQLQPPFVRHASFCFTQQMAVQSSLLHSTCIMNQSTLWDCGGVRIQLRASKSLANLVVTINPLTPNDL
jgi:hypothetical protein